MAKTYLQLINLVHARLRAAAVTTITQDADTTILGAFVNQAKEQVEQYKWHALRKTITFNSVGGTASYDTSLLATVSSDPAVTNERSILLYDSQTDLPLFWDTTHGGVFRMNVQGLDGVQDYIYTSDGTNSTSSPGVAAVYQNGVGLTVLFADTPTGVRSYTMLCHVPQDELTDGSTTILAPWQPIRDLACALTAEERGDLYGVPAQRFYDLYQDSLEFAMAAQKDSVYDDSMKVI